MPSKLDVKSENKLREGKPELLRLTRRAKEISDVEFFVIEVLRTVTKQKENVAKGVSQTMKSRHLTGHALDFGVKVDGAYLNGDTTEEYALYERVAKAFKQASSELVIPIIWGGDWRMRDGGHIELDRRVYP